MYARLPNGRATLRGARNAPGLPNKRQYQDRNVGSFGDSEGDLILCFDFDLTLTTRDSGGYPDISTEYFTDVQKWSIHALFSAVRSIFNCKIFIITRADQRMVVKYISERCDFMSGFIDGVYGSSARFPRTELPSGSVAAHRDIAEGRDLALRGTSQYWANLKAFILGTIKSRNKNSRVLFFDDTQINIDAARRRNISAFIVDRPSNLHTITANAINSALA